MDKVYLILRDNRQTGPYTIGELLQQQLRPTDMIWIEGRSTAWAYVSEMELNPSIDHVSKKDEKSRVITDPAKRPATSPTPAVPETNKPKRRSSPHDEIEKKAEELRKQALTTRHQYSRFTDPQIILEEYQSRVVAPVEEEIDFVDHRERKKLPVVEIMSGVLVTAFVIACFFGGRSLIINQQNTTPTIVAAKEVSTSEHTAKRTLPAPASMIMVSNNEIAIPADSTKIDSSAIVQKPKVKISRPVSNKANNKTGLDVVPVEPIAVNTKKETESVSESNLDETEIKKIEVEEKKDPVTTASNTEALPVEKKKGLFKKIFGKKKKDE